MSTYHTHCFCVYTFLYFNKTLLMNQSTQKGSILLEILISIFVFAFGILALILFNIKMISTNTEMTIRDITLNSAQEYINSINYNKLTTVCCGVKTYPCPATNIPIQFKAETANLCALNSTAVITFDLAPATTYSANCRSMCTGKKEGTVNIKWLYKGEWQSYSNYVSNMEFQ